jgi:hypothetical protein
MRMAASDIFEPLRGPPAAAWERIGAIVAELGGNEPDRDFGGVEHLGGDAADVVPLFDARMPMGGHHDQVHVVGVDIFEDLLGRISNDDRSPRPDTAGHRLVADAIADLLCAGRTSAMCSM